MADLDRIFQSARRAMFNVLKLTYLEYFLEVGAKKADETRQLVR